MNESKLYIERRDAVSINSVIVDLVEATHKIDRKDVLVLCVITFLRILLMIFKEK